MGKKEYAIWGTRNGREDIVRVNGNEVQNSRTKATKIKSILDRRGEFQRTRIQTIDHSSFDMGQEFTRGINKRRRG